MNRIVEYLLKGIVAAIWFVAAVVTSILLSPFIFAGWISGILTKSGGDDKDKLE